MVIISTRGLQIKETACSIVPDALAAVIIKSAVPVKLTLLIVTWFLLNTKGMGTPFCVTVIPCLVETFFILAVIEATQDSVVIGDDAGEMIVTSGGGITGHAPRVSP